MHILVVHIGPVQDFIESARKCRDLWFGSWLLSELARAAAKGLVVAEGRPEADVLVFPGARTSDNGRSVANKIVARVARPPAEVAKDAEGAMRARLQEIRERAFRRVAPGHRQRDKLFHEDVARQQVDDAMEFLWAAAPEGEGGYKAALDAAERLLGAVKNTRRWEQPGWAAAGVPKSSLDGLRESVLDEALYPNPRRPVDNAPPDADRLRRSFGVHRAERLCGVGILKRFGNDDSRDGPAERSPDRIFSTSHVASGPFRAGLAAIGAGDAWERYRRRLEQIDPDIVPRLQVVPRSDALTGRVDGAVFYEARVIELLEELGVDSKPNVEDARHALRDLLKAVRPIGEPVPYYAILLGDGDRMGKVIEGLSGATDHRKLSEALERFASSTRKLVEELHFGALIYAGGDDILALVPLHRALRCAADLADGFRIAMQEWKVHEDGVERSPTLSVGMVIVHQLLPLDEALAMVRSTEKEAKAVRGKNALAVVVKKRGGEAVQVEGRWGEIDERLRALMTLHREEAISSKTQYELMDLAQRMEGAGKLAPTLKKVRAAETERLLARKRGAGGAALLDDATRALLERSGAFDDPARLGRELYVAKLLAQAERQASPPTIAGARAPDLEVTP